MLDDEDVYIQGTTPEDPKQEYEGAQSFAGCMILSSVTLLMALLIEMAKRGW